MAIRRIVNQLCVISFFLALPSVCAADDWSSMAYVFDLMYALALVFGVQSFATIVMAAVRARERGWLSSAAYVGGSILVMLASFPAMWVAMWTVAKLPWPKNLGPAATAVLLAIVPLVCWLLFLASVRRHDRIEKNIV